MRTVEALEIAINQLSKRLNQTSIFAPNVDQLARAIDTLEALRQLIVDGAFDEYQALFEKEN